MPTVKTEAKIIKLGQVYRHMKHKLIFIVGLWSSMEESEVIYYRFRKVNDKGRLSKEVFAEKHTLLWKVPDMEVRIRVVKKLIA